MKIIDILIVDDTVENIMALQALLEHKGYAVRTAASGAEALQAIESKIPDIVLLDVMMPEMSGYEVCQSLRQKPETALLPVILLTALDPVHEKVKGIEAGADEFLTKPINRPELFARIESLLRITELQKEIADKNMQLLNANQELEAKVSQQVNEIEKLNQLMRALPLHVANTIMANGQENILKPHRAEITIAFFELRGFGNLVMERETEEVMIVLNEFHQILGTLIDQFGGTVQRLSSDEIVLFFNDPIPVENSALQAVNLSKRFQIAFANLKSRWVQRGVSSRMTLGLGTGIATGYATIGMIGFKNRQDYSAIGAVTEIVSRLCRESSNGEIILDSRTYSRLPNDPSIKPRGPMLLKDIGKSMEAYKILT